MTPPKSEMHLLRRSDRGSSPAFSDFSHPCTLLSLLIGYLVNSKSMCIQFFEPPWIPVWVSPTGFPVGFHQPVFRNFEQQSHRKGFVTSAVLVRSLRHQSCGQLAGSAVTAFSGIQSKCDRERSSQVISNFCVTVYIFFRGDLHDAY